MADTDFTNLAATNTIAATDQILIVRNGAAFRFVGILPAVDAAGTVATGNGITTAAFVANARNPIWRFGNAAVVGLSYFQGTAGISGDLFGFHFGEATAAASSLLIGDADVRFGRTARPTTDNSIGLGTAASRWSAIYAGTGAIQTSDASTKQDIGTIPDDWLDAWADVEWVRFRFIDAVEEKGDAARWHVGLVAQQVRDAFATRGLDALSIGLLCYDEWEATKAVKAVTEKRDKAGEITREARAAIPAVPAGDRWGLRYDECQAIEAAYQRRRMTRIEARLAQLAS